MFLEDYGVSVEQLWRQFGIAQFLHENIGEEESGEGEGGLLWDPEGGSFAGWKRGFGWKVRSYLCFLLTSVVTC